MRPMLLPLVSLLLHVWIGWRLAPALGAPWSAALVAVLALSALTAPLGLGLRRAAGRGRLLHVASRIGLIAIGLFSSLLVLTLLRDLGLVLLTLVERFEPAWLSAGALQAAEVASARAVAGLALFASAWGFLNARRTAAVRRVDVPIAGLPDGLNGFTIAQLSDMHVGPTIRRPYVERVVAAVNALDADLVAITGDLVDGSVRELAPHVAPLAELRSREGTFFVTGNHEYYSGADAWVAEPVTSTAPARATRHRRWPIARPRRCACCSRTSRAAPRRPKPRASTCSSRGTPTAASSCRGISWCGCSSRSPPA